MSNQSAYTAHPLSRHQIRKITQEVRRFFGLEKEIYFPVVQIIERLHEFLGDPDFYMEIVDSYELTSGTHAEFSITDNCIRIRKDVYEAACRGSGRDRMTMIHEGGHAILIKNYGYSLARSFGGEVPPYMDPEWQAKCFAGELLAPTHLVTGLTPVDISRQCGISMDAAMYQHKVNQRR